ncbi:transporter substrate-binding domain-containing protein [Magnetovibrio sp. PR-2]|uniref:substrate-binding periplasmic protein n=1 Tax=Magnetovibrio sp. PR-2 TaxID=3120356 RepID=UPI002FCE44D0
MFLTHCYTGRLKNLTLSFAVVVALLLDSFASADPQNTSIEFGFCPVEGFVDEEPKGVGYELMTEVLMRLRAQGYQINESFVPAMRLLNGYKNKQYDVIFPIMKIKNFTLKSFQKWGFDHIPLYSRPLYDGGHFVIYTHVENDRLNRVKDLKGKSTVVIAGAYIPVDLVTPTPYNVEYVDTAEQAFKMVQFGRVDAFLVHKGWGQHVLSGLDLPELHHGEPFENIRGGFIAQENELGEELVSAIDRVIADMIEDGSYAKILEKFPDTKLVIHPD